MNKDCPYCKLNCPFAIKEQCPTRHVWHGVERKESLRNDDINLIISNLLMAGLLSSNGVVASQSQLMWTDDEGIENILAESKYKRRLSLEVAAEIRRN